MSEKDDALQDIIRVAEAHKITAEEIVQAFSLSDSQSAKQSSGILTRLLGYIGGILIFAGICVFISMYWDDFGSAPRVVVTLGTGFAAFIMGLACLGDSSYERAATPLFLISSLLQPTGIFVMLNEYASGGDPHHGVLFMAVYMLVQQGATFLAKERTVLAFSAILFGCIFFATLFDLWGMGDNLIGIATGISLLCIAYALDHSSHLAIAPFWYFAGSVALLWSVFDAIKRTPFELAYLGLCALMIYVSTHLRSRTLLLVSTLSMLGYIGYYTAEHFANTAGWPIALVIVGVSLIGLSSLAVRLNNKYIR